MASPAAVSPTSVAPLEPPLLVHPANVLTIAGSDPSGGAGIQADIKAFSALGTYATSVITALTAQNTRAVTGVFAVPPEFVRAQLDALLADVQIDAVKVGMLANAAIARAVADWLAVAGIPHVVVDPVMVAKSGDRLLDADAIDSVRRRVVPLASVLTPNLPEAGVLLGRAPPTTLDEMQQAGVALAALGARHVLVKGGHLAGAESPDVLCDGQDVVQLAAPRVPTQNTHGTGCTLSAAIAALLPRHADVTSAVRAAKDYVSAGLRASHQLAVGSGHGPLHHFHAFWPELPA
jgi:hydroxymethylpyrimidine/phosphomethylpyrimidine kinase